MALAPEEVGERIANARKERGWTHERLAREAGVGLRTVQRWQKGRDPKTGKSWLPRLTTLMEIAELLNVPKSYFVETDVPEPTDPAVLRQMLREEVSVVLAQVEELLERLLRQAPEESDAVDRSGP